jgi:2-polyprenyl-6-hydroxyphenyl methylase / 3-demethylubiquinone-9 3-methyltransferase
VTDPVGGLPEPAKYERLVEQSPGIWWSDTGPFVGLHELNVVRVNYFRTAFKGFRGKRVLDVGCGGGILAESLAREGAQVVGIDPSERSIAAACAHAEQSKLAIDYRSGAAETLDAGELGAPFDLVFAVDVLEHVDDLDRTLAAIARVLAPGGGLGFLTHNRTPAAFLDLIWDEEYERRSMPQGFHEFARFIPPAELIGALMRQGIVVREMKGVARDARGQRACVDDTSVTYIGWGLKTDR